LNTINSVTETTEKIVNNWLEGAAETIEVEIRLNVMMKPLQWNPSDPTYGGLIGGGMVVVKNLFEYKNGARILAPVSRNRVSSASPTRNDLNGVFQQTATN
jgi:hypothetical protein